MRAVVVGFVCLVAPFALNSNASIYKMVENGVWPQQLFGCLMRLAARLVASLIGSGMQDFNVENFYILD